MCVCWSGFVSRFGESATTKVEKQLIVKGLLWLFSGTNCMARRLSLNQVLSICALKKYCNNCQRGWVNYLGVLFKSRVGDLHLTSVSICPSMRVQLCSSLCSPGLWHPKRPWLNRWEHVGSPCGHAPTLNLGLLLSWAVASYNDVTKMRRCCS